MSEEKTEFEEIADIDNEELSPKKTRDLLNSHLLLERETTQQIDKVEWAIIRNKRRYIAYVILYTIAFILALISLILSSRILPLVIVASSFVAIRAIERVETKIFYKALQNQKAQIRADSIILAPKDDAVKAYMEKK